MRGFDAAKLCAVFLCIEAIAPCAARPIDEMGERFGVKRLSSSPEGDHTCFVRADGNLVCWGSNASGQIGDGSSGNVRGVATRVPGITTAVAVAAGRDHTCVLLVSGSVRCFGSNATGQLGVGASTASSSVPVTVPGLTSVVAITAGTGFTCARRGDGSVRCWGTNQFGQLGDGTTTSPRFTPVAVSGMSDAVKLVAGATHACALRGGGVVSCWGGNGQGQLGNGNTSDRSLPSSVLDIAQVIDVAAGLRFTCASRRHDPLDATGSLFCWGDNDLGQLGTGALSDNAVRPVVMPSPTNPTGHVRAIDLAAGATHGCLALGFRNELRCWGGNVAAQLGAGFTSISEPLRAMEESDVHHPLAIAAGRLHSCSLAGNEEVRCWGDNSLGQLGLGTSALIVPTPSLVPGIYGSVGVIGARSLAAGTDHSCAVRADGGAHCWGRNAERQIGDGTTTDRLVPRLVFGGVDVPVVTIAAGGQHTCAATDMRETTHCWGDNRQRQTDPTSFDAFVPVPRPMFIRDMPAALSSGVFHGCWAEDDGSVGCNGSNANGQLSGTSLGSVDGIRGFRNVVAVAAGAVHSCALHATGRVSCWGNNDFGQLGDATRTPSNAPREALGIVNAVALSTNRHHTCALLATGSLVCWGRNDFGQVDGTLGGDRVVPTPVAMLAAGTVASVAVGGKHTCVLTPGGLVRCWGSNNQGQLGNNTLTDSRTPVTVLRSAKTPVPLDDVIGLVADNEHNCALRVSGQPACWGRNAEGQLGDDTRTRRLTATGVGSFTANIAREAWLAARNRTLDVIALVNCPAGEHFVGEITVTQGSASGSGRISGTCTGGLEGYPLVVPAQGRDGFAAGAAEARAEIVVHARGEVSDEQQWTRMIEVLP